MWSTRPLIISSDDDGNRINWRLESRKWKPISFAALRAALARTFPS